MNAQNICVNSNILKSNSKLPIRSEATSGESDSTLMDALSALQSAKIFSGGTGAYFLESIVSDVSIDSSKATNMQINYQSLKKTIDNQRLSVMGGSSSSRLATTRSLITTPPSRLEAARVDSFISVPPFTGGQAAGTSKDPAGRMMHCPKALCFYYNIN